MTFQNILYKEELSRGSCRPNQSLSVFGCGYTRSTYSGILSKVHVLVAEIESNKQPHPTCTVPYRIIAKPWGFPAADIEISKDPMRAVQYYM